MLGNTYFHVEGRYFFGPSLAHRIKSKSPKNHFLIKKRPLILITDFKPGLKITKIQVCKNIFYQKTGFFGVFYSFLQLPQGQYSDVTLTPHDGRWC